MTVTLLMPAFGMAWGALFLGEAITGPMLAGAALIVAGTALVAFVGASPSGRRTGPDWRRESNRRRYTGNPDVRPRPLMNAPESHVAPAIRTLIRLVHKQREAFARERYPTLEVRRDRLDRLRKLVVENEEAVVAAICADFGARSAHETLLGEIVVTANGVRDALRDVARWMKPRRVPTPLTMLPAGVR